jgi:hypothetical protein
MTVGEIGRAAVLADAPTFETLAGYLAEHPSSSLQALLTSLPESYRSRFTLIKTSKSLQQASPLQPRAIIFGLDAKLIMTFNGDASQSGFDDLEVMQFRDETNSFELHRISFPSRRNGLSQVKISGTNPEVCLGCHGTEPVPIWGEYDEWDGAYGNHQLEIVSGDEQAELAAFLAGRLNDPRYSTLRPLPGSEVSPFNDGKANSILFRPNTVLGFLLNRLRALQIGQTIARAFPARLGVYAWILDSSSCVLPQESRDDLKRYLAGVALPTYFDYWDGQYQLSELLPNGAFIAAMAQDPGLIPFHIQMPMYDDGEFSGTSEGVALLATLGRLGGVLELSSDACTRLWRDFAGGRREARLDERNSGQVY